MPRTPPSRADRQLIDALAARGVTVTPARLERWRSQRCLPRNVRHGLGRGAGSTSEVVPGLLDYVQALTTVAGQGHSVHRAMLALFMAGVLQPNESALFITYEAAVRQAFRRQIKAGDAIKRQISDAAIAEDLPAEDALDRAFELARRVGRSQARLTRPLSDFAAKVTGMPTVTSAEIAQLHEEAILLSAEVGHVPSGREMVNLSRDLETRGLPPLDLDIWASPSCATCEARLEHSPGSDQGRLELLDATPFWELDRARALAGTICMMADSFRTQAIDDPDNVLAQQVMKLFSVTFLRSLLTMPRMVDARRPESIVFATLAYLHDCRLLKSAARAVLQVAYWMIPHVEGDPNILATGFRAIAQSMPRTDLSPENTHVLLMADGSVAAAEAVLRPVLH